MSPLEVLTQPDAFFKTLRERAGNDVTQPVVILLLTVLVPNFVLTLITQTQMSVLPASIVGYVIFLSLMLGFVVWLARINFARALEVVGYSCLPFLIASTLFGTLSILGSIALTLGPALMLAGLVMGWLRLYKGLEVMAGASGPALRGALISPITSFVVVGFVGLLFRLIGLA